MTNEDLGIEVLGHIDDTTVGTRNEAQTPIIYLSHPSDPVKWSAVSTLWKPPQWVHSPVGYDVTTDARWFPGVTFIQSLFDLMAGFSAPPGHGHDYVPSLANGWAAVIAPEQWTTADTERLQAVLNSDT